MAEAFFEELDTAFAAADGARVIGLCVRRYESHGDLATQLFWYLEQAVIHQHAGVLDNLDCVPDDFALRGLLDYARACVAARRFDLDETALHLKKAFNHSMQVLEVFAAEESYASRLVPFIAKEAYNAEASTFHAAQEIVLPNIDLPEPASRPGFFVLAGCNGTYFDRFFERYRDTLAGFEEDGVYHIHVANPTAQTLEVLEGLKDSRFHISLEQTNHGASYFACMRLFLAPRLMDHYGCGGLISDIDVDWLVPPSRIWDSMAGADFGYFSKPGPAPSLLVHAQLLGVADSASGRDILEKSTTYLASKLSGYPSWCLDQSSLFRAACLTEGGKVRDLEGAPEALAGVQLVQDETVGQKWHDRGYLQSLVISAYPDGCPDIRYKTDA